MLLFAASGDAVGERARVLWSDSMQAVPFVFPFVCFFWCCFWCCCCCYRRHYSSVLRGYHVSVRAAQAVIFLSLSLSLFLFFVFFCAAGFFFLVLFLFLSWRAISNGIEFGFVGV